MKFIGRNDCLSFSHLWFNPPPYYPSNPSKTVGFRKNSEHYINVLFFHPETDAEIE